MDALEYAHDVGLKAIAIVCDQESSQARLWRELRVSPQAPWILHPLTGENVYIVPDPVHLLKSIRNNLMNHPIQVSLYPACSCFRVKVDIAVLRCLWRSWQS